MPMPIKAADLEHAARMLGFLKVSQRGIHARWRHRDLRATTIPIKGEYWIGSWLSHEILEQLGITEEELSELQ